MKSGDPSVWPFPKKRGMTLGMTTLYIPRADGLELAYRYHAAPAGAPTLLFLPGYMSDMAGSKAAALFDWAVANGHGCLLLDYAGCGESEGAFRDGTLTSWRDDVLAVVDAVLGDDDPLIVIGSSMGGWLMLLVALALPNRVKALVGIAAAPDFTDWGFAEDQKALFRAGRTLEEPSDYSDEPYVTTAAFWESGEANHMLDGRMPEGEIAFDGPVRLIHGQADADVPWEVSLTLAAALRSSDVQTRLIKDGDHRLSRDGDIAILLGTVADLLAQT